MNKPSPIIWLAIVLILLVPSAAGRFLLDLAGGLLLFILFLPIIIAGIGWISWQLLKPKFQQCDSCGTTFFNEVNRCPICGTEISTKKDNEANKTIPASSAIIDIVPEEKKDN